MITIRKKIFSFFCVLTFCLLPISNAHAEYSTVAWLKKGSNTTAESNYIYVNPGNTLHIFAQNYSSSNALMQYKIYNSVNILPIQLGKVKPNSTTAFSKSVPVGWYKIKVLCENIKGCTGKGQLND